MTTGWTGIRLALRHRNYRLFVAGQLLSLLGTYTQAVALSWLVYRLGGSAVWLGVAMFCQQAPIVVLASLGGSLADRHRRRSILVATQSAAMVLAFTLAALALSGTVQLAHVLVLATLAGVVSAIDIPTRQSFVVEMVGRDSLMTAVAINSAMATCATSLGPVLAGFGVVAFGEGWCFLANGVSFLAVIGGLLAMRDLPAPVAGRPHEALAVRIAEGFRFARGDARVRALFALLAVTAFAAIPYGTLFPVFAKDVFHGDARALGALTGAAGFGALLGAGALALRRGGAPLERWVGVACLVLGAALVAFSLQRDLWWSLVALVPVGAATIIQVSATNTLVQTIAPDALRGRVMAIWAMILMGFNPLGGLLASTVASFVSPTLPLAIGGTVCMIAAVVFIRRRDVQA
ncbi:MAG TPA: MFS transporter [Kofleriaceae bacterium]|nr:MFS transporter [Kofleriaceae bacterium]